MRTFNFTIIITVVLVILTACSMNDSPENRITTFDQLHTMFADPPSEYRPSPLWVWNDDVTGEKIDFHLEEFKNQGFGGVFIHPRPGLITEYLSDDWSRLLEHTLDKAQQLDLEVWMYDENTYPSGYAGGHVQREMPSSYTQGQGLRMVRRKNIPANELSEVYLALEETENGFENVTSSLADEMNADKELYLFYKAHNRPNGRLGGKPYPDLLVEGVTQTFMDITMPVYEKEFGDEFGRDVPGIFTDEPNINPPSGDAVKWTPSLFEDFQERWGYDLRDHLPSLFLDTGDFRKVRHNYYQLLADLFIDRWCKPWYEYTEKHNLKWTGHYWEHAWPNPRHGGDNMAFYAYHQMPGVDMLFNTREERPDQFGNVLAVRELRSVANQMGRERTLSETYGGSGWSLTFEDMQRNGDWEYVIGVNFMNQHLSYMTLKGTRKRDYPQSFSYQAPWWEQYHHMSDRYGRLSAAMSAGGQMNQILVLHPNTTTWIYFSPEQDRDRADNARDFDYYGRTFKDFLHTLEMQQIEYDLGDETMMRDFGDVDGQELIVGKRAYDMVVIPPAVENINASTYALLEEYLRNGGEVLSFGELPNRVEGECSDEVIELQQHHINRWQIYDNPDSPQWLSQLQAADFQVENPEDIGGELYHQRRIMEDGQLLFWMNYSEDEPVEIHFSITGETLLHMDLQDGKVYHFPSEKSDGKLNASLTLPPGGSILLFAHHDGYSATPARNRNLTTEGEIVQPESVSISREEPNALPLDYCNLEVMGREFRELYYIAATDTIYKYHGFEQAAIDHNPWNFNVQYKTETLDRNNFPEGTGFTAEFPFEVASEYQPTDMRLGVEWGHLYQITVNGEPVSPPEKIEWLDNSITVYDISAFVRPGTNSITLECRPMDIHAELERIFLVGEFGVQPADKGFLITAPPQELAYGSWHVQGLTFYSESVNYTQTIRVNDTDKTYGVYLPEWKGTVAAVRVNGNDAGIIGWKPYKMDITDHVQPGKNRVQVIVYGSFKNLLGPHHNVSRYGIVTPWSWNSAPPVQPPGETYDLFEYGLMENFQVISYN